MLAQFRAHRNAVLVATMSFWEGVDIPGKALRLVVLDKIPFPVPSDPVLRARSESIEDDGGRAFTDLHIPMAQMALKQGFGRLIRHRNDWGVVALLDGRIHRRGYGRRILAALPPAKQTDDIDEVTAFFRQHSTGPQ